jgi:hypothetical protein
MLALGIEALKRENINIEELKTAYKVLIKAANIDKKQILCEISMEIEETHQNLDEMDAEERGEAREYINILEKLKEILQST